MMCGFIKWGDWGTDRAWEYMSRETGRMPHDEDRGETILPAGKDDIRPAMLERPGSYLLRQFTMQSPEPRFPPGHLVRGKRYFALGLCYLHLPGERVDRRQKDMKSERERQKKKN